MADTVMSATTRTRGEPHREALGGSEGKGRSRPILLNTLSSYARDIVDALTLIVLTPFLIRTLGAASFGLWSLIWSFVSLFVLFDLGFGTSVVKFIADAKGRGDLDRQRRVVATLFWIYSALGAGLMLAVVGSLAFFNRLFDIPAGRREVAGAVLLFLGMRAAVCMPFGMFRGVLIGHQKSVVANAYKILAGCLYFVLVLVGLTWLPDLRTLAVLNMAVGILPMVAMMVHALRTIPGLTVHPRFFDRTVVKEVSAFSFYFLVIQVSGLVYTRVDALIIKSFLPLEMVGIYAIAMRLSEKGQQFCSHLTKALTPVVAELHGAGDDRNVRAVWIKGAKLTTAFATPLLLGLGVLARPLILAWTGPEFELAVPVLQWLCAAALVNVIHGNTANILSMGGEQRFLSFALLGGQAVNLLLSILLIRPLGIVGVGMATLVSTLPLQVLVVQTRAHRAQGRRHLEFYARTVLPSLLPAVIMVSVVIGAQRFWTLDSLLEVALMELAAILVFAGAFWLLGFSAHEREYFSRRVLRRVRQRGSQGSIR